MTDDIRQDSSEVDSVNVWAAIQALISGWRLVAKGGLIGLLAGAAFLLVAPTQYEATALIQPASVGISSTNTVSTGGVTNATIRGFEVESPQQAMERLKLSSFYTDDLVTLCQTKTSWLSFSSDLRQKLSDDIKVKLVKGNTLVEVAYRAKSQAIAESCVKGVVAQMTTTQEKLAKPLIDALKEQIQLTKTQLEDSERFQKLLESRAMNMDPSEAKFSQTMLMLNAALSKREEINKLRKVYTELSLQLAEPLTQGTTLLEPVTSSEDPVFPQKGLTLFAGLVLGLFSGVMVLFLRLSWNQYSAQARKTD